MQLKKMKAWNERRRVGSSTGTAPRRAFNRPERRAEAVAVAVAVAVAEDSELRTERRLMPSHVRH
ncbi:hypothetical protein H6P81_018797 [Aristolochia fimbriata]|uniref:Uncharacterized protein n=1 Tax=Aristolochia fimbriata TaxID=158543 RepID=A0AAV7E2A9_ARIFI|nr:hypothetical protein H6P81_018797 [Aristolochia fimbriata]